MSRKVLIVVREEDGVTYGRVVKATEQMSMQDFAHMHIEEVVRDKLMHNAPQAEVSGFNHTLPGDMDFSVGEGHAIDVAGRSFDTLPSGAASMVTIPGAHASLPRIDLVYVTLVADSDREETPLPFRRQLTEAELAAGADPYPITNTNVPTRRDNIAVIAVRQGVPASVPAAPATGANEVALYEVRVNAGVTAITADKVTDVRPQMKSLHDALVRLDTLEALPAVINFTEAVQDALTNFFPDASPFDWTVDDANNKVVLDIATATALLKGLMSAADKAKLDAATSAATASALAQRDVNGDSAFRDVQLRNANLSGRVTSYDGLTTALIGVPPVVAGFDSTATGSVSGTIMASPVDSLYRIEFGVYTRQAGTGGTAVLALSYKDGSPVPGTRTETLPAISLAASDRQRSSFTTQMLPGVPLAYTLTFTGATGSPAPEVYFWFVVQRLKN